MADSRLPLVDHVLSLGGQSTKRLIREWADEVGLVYFGYVSQRDDEHHIVRGMTVSTKHHDDHYCIGTYEGYDVVFVERSDNLQSGKKHTWHIIEYDLKTNVDLPHLFIGSSTKGNGFHELLDAKYTSLIPIELGLHTQYPKDFMSKFTIYTSPAHAHTIDQIVTADIAATIATHFTGLAIEISDQSLYIYSEKNHLSNSLLHTMLKNGAWLASHLDEKSRQQ